MAWADFGRSDELFGLDRAKLASLCSISVIELGGAFVRGRRTIESNADRTRNILRWFEKEGSWENVERVVNHVHVYDEFEDLTESGYEEAASKILHCWEVALTKIDPAFQVEKFEDYGPSVTFYKRRSI